MFNNLETWGSEDAKTRGLRNTKCKFILDTLLHYKQQHNSLIYVYHNSSNSENAQNRQNRKPRVTWTNWHQRHITSVRSILERFWDIWRHVFLCMSTSFAGCIPWRLNRLTFLISFSISAALITIGPRTAYSICLIWGFMVDSVRTRPRRPFVAEKQRRDRTAISLEELRGDRLMVSWNISTVGHLRYGL